MSEGLTERQPQRLAERWDQPAAFSGNARCHPARAMFGLVGISAWTVPSGKVTRPDTRRGAAARHRSRGRGAQL